MTQYASVHDIASMQPALTQKDMQVRDNFVEQYFLDFMPIRAVIRLGYNETYAEHMANQFMRDSYVLNQIEHKKRNINEQEQKLRLKAWVTAELMSRAQDCLSADGARISALRTLITLHGLHQPIEKSPLTPPDPKLVRDVIPEVVSRQEFIESCRQKGLPIDVVINDLDYIYDEEDLEITE